MCLFLLKVMPLNELLKSLEDNGEVNYQVAEHKLSKDAAGNFTVQPLQKVVFCLDAPKPKKKKAKARALLSESNCSLPTRVTDLFVLPVWFWERRRAPSPLEQSWTSGS